MPLNKLLDKMISHNFQTGTFDSVESKGKSYPFLLYELFPILDSLRDKINELTKACPNWIRMISDVQGILIKVHKYTNATSCTLKQNIKDYLASREQKSSCGTQNSS